MLSREIVQQALSEEFAGARRELDNAKMAIDRGYTYPGQDHTWESTANYALGRMDAVRSLRDKLQSLSGLPFAIRGEGKLVSEPPIPSETIRQAPELEMI